MDYAIREQGKCDTSEKRTIQRSGAIAIIHRERNSKIIAPIGFGA
jgi:hypothetical protein